MGSVGSEDSEKASLAFNLFWVQRGGGKKRERKKESMRGRDKYRGRDRWIEGKEMRKRIGSLAIMNGNENSKQASLFHFSYMLLMICLIRNGKNHW